MSVLKKLLADVGIDPMTEARNTVAGRYLSREGVHADQEFNRIKALPQRRWEDAADLDELVRELTALVSKHPNALPLWRHQAAALRELHDTGKLCVVAGVGAGKTLITALAPTILGSKRPLLITYKKLLRKTIKEFRRLAEDYKVAQNFQFLGAEEFSREKCADFLDRMKPDLVIVDESHLFKNPKSGRSKRFARWRKDNPHVPFLPLTGTPGDATLMNISHVQEWTHGPEASPVPTKYHTLKSWCEALDAVVEKRRSPGVLAEFAGGNTELGAVRNAIGERIANTPGNIYYRSQDVDCSLYLQSELFNDYSPYMEEFFEAVRKTEKTPEGRVLKEAQIALACTTAALGFVHVIDPPPPEPWRQARKEYFAFVNDVLSQTKYGLETPMQVGNLCHRGEIDSDGLYEAWKELEPTFKIHSQTVWFDESILKFAAEWLAEEKGIVWTPYPELGKKLAALSEVPFFWQQGESADSGNVIDYYKPTGAILSLYANKEGLNLQDRWEKMLILAPSSSSDVEEQRLGRLHRHGQKAEAVEATYVFGCTEHAKSFYRARAKAEYDRAENKNNCVKLLTGDFLVADWSEISKQKGFRWAA